VAGLALEGIGIASENNPPFHYIFSVAFFSIMPISLLLIARYFLLTHQTKLGTFTLIVAFSAATPWVLYYNIHYVQGVAIPELLSALAGVAWSVVIGWKMFKAASQLKSS